MSDSKLTYDIVIATRNRLDALGMSIPLMLGQSRVPRKLIVVDSSDDHASVKELVLFLTKEWTGETFIEYVEIPSSSEQRNIGICHVSADIVFFPDDDSLWHPNVADAIMKIYEADEDKSIGGVCAKPVTYSPLDGRNLAYKKSFKSYIKTSIQPIRNRIEDKLFKKPFNLYAYEKWESMPAITWLKEYNAVVVENMAGFRMTFRTELMKEFGFDGTLGYKVGYAIHEDMEASIHTLSKGQHLIGALDAKVYHHVHPSQRANGYSYGFCQIANYLYIVKKHMDDKSLASKSLSCFMLYKIFIYLMGCFDPYKRQLFIGALYAWNNRRVILDSDKSELSINYKKLIDQHLVKFV